ncbi:MAG: hypothetical protein WBM76_09175, partial [Woeseiaceae bacterium]
LEAHKSVDRIMACNPEQVYLTHYSRVRNLDRLAADMHAGIDDYAQMALDLRDENNRGHALQLAMHDYLSERVLEHGFTGDADAIRSIIEVDVTLNSAGLVSWLNRLDKGRT